MRVISYITPSAHSCVAHKAKSKPAISHDNNFTKGGQVNENN